MSSTKRKTRSVALTNEPQNTHNAAAAANFTEKPSKKQKTKNNRANPSDTHVNRDTSNDATRAKRKPTGKVKKEEVVKSTSLPVLIAELARQKDSTCMVRTRVDDSDINASAEVKIQWDAKIEDLINELVSEEESDDENESILNHTKDVVEPCYIHIEYQSIVDDTKCFIEHVYFCNASKEDYQKMANFWKNSKTNNDEESSGDWVSSSDDEE